MASVFALAGRRIDAAGAEPRFPLANVTRVRHDLCGLFHNQEVGALFCAAACGADLIALDVADELRIPMWIVLPFAPALFRSTSVIDRPGDWGSKFDQLVLGAERAGHLIAHDLAPDDDTTYLHANEAILNAAVEHAEGREVTAVVIWEGNPRQGVDITHAFAESARARGMPVHEISTR